MGTERWYGRGGALFGKLGVSRARGSLYCGGGVECGLPADGATGNNGSGDLEIVLMTLRTI